MDPELSRELSDKLRAEARKAGAQKTTLGDSSAERKQFPLFRGVLRYFPAALAGCARVSRIGNDKHNPGEEMHHSRLKSGDHADCILRHLIDLGERGGVDEDGVPQVDYIVWRACALSQEWYEQNRGAPLAPGAKEADSDRVIVPTNSPGYVEQLGARVWQEPCPGPPVGDHED